MGDAHISAHIIRETEWRHQGHFYIPEPNPRLPQGDTFNVAKLLEQYYMFVARGVSSHNLNVNFGINQNGRRIQNLQIVITLQRYKWHQLARA